MRLSILPTLLAGLGVATLAAAEPIRIIDGPSNANANIRFGHALANANVNGNDYNVATGAVRTTVIMTPPEGKNEGFTRHLCGGSLREKAVRVSNAFRHALGLPLIEAGLAIRPSHVQILPVGYPAHNVILQSQEAGEEGKHGKHHHHDGEGDQDDHHHRHHRGRHGHHGHRGKSFLKRIHKAIKALGPWEGRAVAFVLGCGIGVLLRMFWVLSVLAYRTVRGERGEETLDHEYIVYGPDSETLFVAPPQYHIDEKISVEAHGETEEHK